MEYQKGKNYLIRMKYLKPLPKKGCSLAITLYSFMETSTLQICATLHDSECQVFLVVLTST